MIRHIRYILSVLHERRPKHARHAFPGILLTAAGGALVLSMPAWMIALGVI